MTDSSNVPLDPVLESDSRPSVTPVPDPNPQPVEHEVRVQKPVLGERADRLSPLEKTRYKNVLRRCGRGVEVIRRHGMHGLFQTHR